MQLGVKDVAEIFDISEKTVYRWIKQGKLPAYRVNEQYRFNRAELLEWATASRINVSPELMHEPEVEGVPLPRLDEALQAGGVHYRVSGTDKASVLRAVVDVMRLPDEVDRSFLYQVLLAREALGSTAVGDSIAIPHVRNPIVLHIPLPMISLCFLEQKVDFGALDGQPVDILFTLISPTVRAHLHLLSKLAFALNDPQFKAVVTSQGAREALSAEARRIEENLRPSVANPQMIT
ncbi:MAG: PTS sugar transporter subunit IIA [Deltaproteobacteria bacterium]|nr:PTS sugar transporter subunit IIA [Deltaproteobacteria bacterium]